MGYIDRDERRHGLSSNEPDAYLYTLRCKVEHWLAEHGQCIDEDRTLAANNLTLWAGMFLSVTRDEVDQLAEDLRRQGAVEFIDRVRASVCGRLATDGRLDPIATAAQAFSIEAYDVLYGE